MNDMNQANDLQAVCELRGFAPWRQSSLAVYLALLTTSSADRMPSTTILRQLFQPRGFRPLSRQSRNVLAGSNVHKQNISPIASATVRRVARIRLLAHAVMARSGAAWIHACLGAEDGQKGCSWVDS
jgi:hypothetical protein